MKEKEKRISGGTSGQASPKSGRSTAWRPIALLGGVIALILIARFFEVGQHLGSLREWIDGLGPWGPLAFALIYIGAVVAAIPGSALTIVAGAIFGSVLGIIIVSIAATTGAALCFLIARYFARDATAEWLAGKEKFRQLDRMTEEHGAIIVALTRLVPLFPFNLLNYGFGLTRVPFWTYLFWSWLCMLPGTLLFVVGSDAISQAVAGGEVPWGLIAAVLLTAGVLALLVRAARNRLRRKEREA